MGCCHSDQTYPPWSPSPSHFNEDSRKQPVSAIKNHPASKQTTPINYKEPPSFKVTPQISKLSSDIMENFIIAKTINQKLSGLAFNSAHLREIIEAILILIEKLQANEREEDKQLIYQIVNESQKISLQELKYHKVLEKFRKSIKEKNIRPESLSRIYHSIANAQKKQKVDHQYSFLPQCQKKKKKEQIEIKFLQTNGYNVLSAQQVQEVIKLEAVGQKIEEFSTRFKFKFESIRSQSEDIYRLLADSFSRYQSDFKGLKYDFDKKEIMKVAQISRNACNYSDNGVVLLLIYLVDACSKLENSGKSVEAIQKIMEKSIKSISDKYPPGQGLKKEQKHLEEVLKKLELKQQFSYKSYSLSPQNKQQSLEQIILDNAKTAKVYKNDFEELLQKTCLELSIKILMGLKLDSDRPNQKAMIRIKEKMLIGKNQQNQERINKDTVRETVIFEEEEYKRKVDQLLSDKKDVTFKISDMLRGKCVFTSIPDIIRTIEKIKAFVLKDQKKRFRIVEIESRFTNKVPISDVTMKIAINEVIVTELQLTVQSNAAAYNFAHKVYELQRAKMFSKIKIVYNYFEEFQGDFKDLVTKALIHAENTSESKDKSLEEIKKKIVALRAQENKEEAESLSLIESYALIQSYSETIRQYFSISNAKLRDVVQIIGENLANPRQQHFPTKLLVSADQQLQDMMLILFNKQMGSWESELGKQIDSVMRSNCSELLKATLLNFFFRSFDISKEIHHMLQFTPEYLKIAEQTKYKKLCGQHFMLLYLQKVFEINKPFELTKTTARLFYQTQQLQNIALGYDGSPKLIVEKIVKGLVVEDNSLETLQFLLQLVRSYLINRDSHNNIYAYFDIYDEMLMKLLEKQPNLDSGISSQAKLVRVKKLLQKKENGWRQASPVLRQIKDDFKKREQMQKWLECELLLAECAMYDAMTKNMQEFQEVIYAKVEQTAAALGLELRGEAVANSQWRIYEYMSKKKFIDKRWVAKHLGKAITQSSRCEGVMFVLKMKTALQQGHKIEEMKIEYNHATQYINLEYKNLDSSDCIILAAAKWKNLSYLNLWACSMGVQGCALLAKADWKNLTSLTLGGNNIEDNGCANLIKAEWKHLASLNLMSNNITAQGCAHLIKADWKNLASLTLGANNIGAQGCAHLIKADWKNLTSLNLSSNDIGAQGCVYLIKADWKNLTSLNLKSNNIGSEGCANLIKSDWKNLLSLDLLSNNIGVEGCTHLAKAQWKNLTYLNLWDNNIQSNMRDPLRKQFINQRLSIFW